MAEIAIEYAAGSRLQPEAETARRLIDAYLGDRPDVDGVTLSPSSDSVFCVSVATSASRSVPTAASI